MHSYNLIKNFIFNKIQLVQNEKNILEISDIDTEILNIKILLSIPEASKALFGNIPLTITENDFIRIKKELETHFNVRMEEGIIIKGLEQQNRDTTWWTGKMQLESENFYWNRYKSYLKKSLSNEIINVIDVDTDIIMNNLENPNNSNFDRYGMVVGHVQSGKTANYSSLICKAADSGYKFIVVIAGGMNNLRSQTQERINESFVGLNNHGNQVGSGVGNSPLNKLPISLTTVEKDFNKQDADRNAQSTNFDTNTTPIILVIKKNTSSLSNVINWLKSQYKNKIKNHAMLMIDDESDYASINTKEEEDPATINKKLRALLEIFHKRTYVAYTATPYANIFIDHQVEGYNDVFIDKKIKYANISQDLFPNDFIYALDAPTNYFGARRIFLDPNRKYLIPLKDYPKDIPSDHDKNFDVSIIPNSLCEAVRVFILNIAIRNLRGQIDKHNSMLIHATRFTNVHKSIGRKIGEYLQKIADDIVSYGMLSNAINLSENINNLKETFFKIYNNLEFNWNEVLVCVCKTIGTIVIREVHQSTSVPLEYRKDRVTNAIVIGGTSVARGYTLEGLSVSYFLRNTIFYDTLMQMGRWFGYRIGYEDICRIYMTKDMIDNFTRIIESTEDLIDDLKRMAKENMTPNDFGLAVKHHPDSGLQVTAKNKQKHTKDIYFEMKLDGHAKETSWLHKNLEKKKNNLIAVNTIIETLSNSKYEYADIGKRHLWRDVDKDVIMIFVNSFDVYSSDPFGLKSKMPIDFIKKYINEIDTKWDVALYSGEAETYIFNSDNCKIEINKEKRELTDKQECHEILNRQVSSGSAEAIVFSKEERQELGSKRKDIRAKMKKPLLMLHILDTTEDHELAAYGISFPGGIKSNNQTIRLKINSVYIQEIMSIEENSDD